jgi:modulator of FtsH protease HflC
MKRISFATWLTAGIVVAVLVIYALTFQVRFSEVAVRVRWGKPVGVVKAPGIYWRWPWPIETNRKYDQRLRTLDAKEAQVNTKDGRSVIVGVYAIWKIKDPYVFSISTSSGTVAEVEQQLRNRINQRRAAVIGNENLSSFINLNEEVVEKSYNELETAMLTGQQTEVGQTGSSLQEAALKDFGIHVEKVALRRISLPEDTTQKVFEQMMAERQKVAAQFREGGKARAEAITAQAEGARKQILAFADSKGAEYKSEGVKAGTSILEKIQAEDADFFEWLRWLDALKAALKQKSTIFLDSNSALFKPFVEPPTSTSGLNPRLDNPATTRPAGSQTH